MQDQHIHRGNLDSCLGYGPGRGALGCLDAHASRHDPLSGASKMVSGRCEKEALLHTWQLPLSGNLPDKECFPRCPEALSNSPPPMIPLPSQSLPAMMGRLHQRRNLLGTWVDSISYGRGGRGSLTSSHTIISLMVPSHCCGRAPGGKRSTLGHPRCSLPRVPERLALALQRCVTVMQ